MNNFSESLFLKRPLVGILRGYNTEEVLQIAEVFYGAGLVNLEITMNSPDALKTIRMLLEKYRGYLNIGAGTVLSVAEVKSIIAVGGQFIVSPVVDIEVISYCKTHSIPIFPGAYTPTEIYQAWKSGARMVKVFPSRNLSPEYIKDVLAPLNEIELMPTGGVNLNNIKSYLNAGAKAVGMGGSLFDKVLIENKDWKGLAEHLIKIRTQLYQLS